MLEIPMKNFSSFTQEVTLDNVPYRLTFTWNTRGEFWSLGIADRARNNLITGIRLVLNYEMLQHYPGRDLPPGALFVIDPKSNARIGRYDFFNDRQLKVVYVPEDEVHG